MGLQYIYPRCVFLSFTFFVRAIRGGGPGTWGILTSVTYRVHPAVPVVWVSISASSGNIDDNYKVVRKFIEHAPGWSALGAGSFLNILPTEMTFLGFYADGTISKANDSLALIRNNLPSGTKFSEAYHREDNFYPVFQKTFAKNNEV